MSSAVFPPRTDRYRFTAGILTLLAHAAFFALLYFGIHWQAQEPEGMAVDLWASLPEVDTASGQRAQPEPPPAEPPPAAAPATPRPAEAPVPDKAEIATPAKKKPAPAKPEKTQPKLSKAEQKRVHAEMEDLIKQQEQAEQLAREAQARQAAAAGQVMDEYVGKIRAKIRRNIVLPPDVAEDTEARFDVTLLPGGEVLDVRLVKKSGSQAYDSAVERAIWKASPLPVPSDADLFSRKFRQFHIKFRAKDKE